jgi:hypothetical protein
MMTVKAIIAPQSSDEDRRMKRQTYFIFGIGVLQIFLLWWLGYTRDLHIVNAASAASAGGEAAAATAGAAAAATLMKEVPAAAAAAAAGAGSAL